MGRRTEGGKEKGRGRVKGGRLRAEGGGEGRTIPWW